jgi:3-deoxy-7-phosphoheptulonate synthase
MRKAGLAERGMMSTLKELLMSAEYCRFSGKSGCDPVRTRHSNVSKLTRETRSTLRQVPALKQLSHLPVIVDPSHGTGKRSLIPPVSRAAVAVGADGLIIEVHPNPEEAFSDGQQSLLPEEFSALMQGVRKYLDVEGKTL